MELTGLQFITGPAVCPTLKTDPAADNETAGDAVTQSWGGTRSGVPAAVLDAPPKEH